MRSGSKAMGYMGEVLMRLQLMAIIFLPGQIIMVFILTGWMAATADLRRGILMKRGG